MSEKHTPGPWMIENIIHGGPRIVHGEADAGTGFRDDVKLFGDTGEGAANIERIVSCVNACEGINPEAVPLMVKALKDLVYFAGMGGDFASNASSLYDNAKAAIAKAAQ